jgi:hypothetical protein
VLLALDASFGLSQLLALLRKAGGDGGGGKEGWTRKKVEKRVRKMVAGGVFQWERVFEGAGKVEEAATGCEGGTRGREEVPVKMEICSGTGDWVVAQEPQKKKSLSYIDLI